MEFHQHRFDSIENYLHHRKPYLMVDGIEEIEKDLIKTTTTVDKENHFFIAGHFPGAPILPGAMMQEITTQSAGILIAANYNPMKKFNTHDPFFNEYALGVLVKVGRAKYRGFARPGDQLFTEVQLEQNLEHVFNFSAKIMVDGNIIMSNQFQLANILSSTLQGVEAVN